MSRRQRTLNEFDIPTTKILPLKSSKNKQIIIIDDSAQNKPITINLVDDDELKIINNSLEIHSDVDIDIATISTDSSDNTENKLFISSDCEKEASPIENIETSETVEYNEIEVIDDTMEVQNEANSVIFSHETSFIQTDFSFVDDSKILCPFCHLNLNAFDLSEREVHCDECMNDTHNSSNVGTNVLLKSLQIRENAKRKNQVPVNKTDEENKKEEKMENDTRGSKNQENKLRPKDTEVKPKKRRKVKINRTTPLPKVKILTFEYTKYQIVVDGFNFAKVPHIDQYFLSHFHSDHYQGLCQNWDQGKIWCSPITKKLIQYKFKIEPDRIEVIENNEKKWINEHISVIAMDANHCPGAQIFLFQEHAFGSNGERDGSETENNVIYQILHTGDFRITDKMIEDIRSKVEFQVINKIYLDNTYFNPYNIHPTQENVISETCSFIKSLLIENDKEDNINGKNGSNGNGDIIKLISNGSQNKDKDKNNFQNIILVGSYAIGKEKLALGISRTVSEYLNETNNKVIEEYDNSLYKDLIYINDKSMRKFFLSNFTHNPQETNVHIVPIQLLKSDKAICQYLKETCQLNWTNCNVIGVIPTGWTFTPGVWNYKQEFTKEDKFNICQGVLRSVEKDDIGINNDDGINDDSEQFASTSMNDEEEFKTNTVNRLIKNVQIDETWFRKQKHKGKFKIFKVPYSEHSNFHELIKLLTSKDINYETIIPTVNAIEKEMTLKEWFQICSMIKKLNEEKCRKG